MITVEKIEPIEHAFERLRKAPLDATGDTHIPIYENARMRITELYPEEVNPTSLFVLKPQLALLREMRARFIDQCDIDILHLQAILHIRTESGEIIGMAPPVVEVYEETVHIIPQDGDQSPPRPIKLMVTILKDGMHRAWIARTDGETITCIKIHRAMDAHKPYAYPNEWSAVREYNSKAERGLKKFFRRVDPYTYMRPLRALRQTGADVPKHEYGSNYR